MPYRFDVTEGEKKVFGHACTWAETHLPKLVEAGRWIDGKISGMVAAGHEDRPGYLLGAIALSYADCLIGDPGAGFDAMLAAERTAAAKRVILLAWLLIAEDTSAGAKITPLAVLPWSPYKGRWLAQSTAFRDRTATWKKLVKTAMEVVVTVESGIAVHTGASKRFAVAFSPPGEKRDCVEGESRIAKYVQPVHFDDFDGHQFERLVFAHHVRESKWERLEWLGQCGQDTGRDICGVRAVEGQTSPEACCILCANWRKLTLAKIKSDIDKVLKSPSGQPDRIRVVCGHKISAQLRDKVKKYAKEKAIHACELWSGQEFEEYLRATPWGESLLRRFIGGEEFPDSPGELTSFAS